LLAALQPSFSALGQRERSIGLSAEASLRIGYDGLPGALLRILSPTDGQSARNPDFGVAPLRLAAFLNMLLQARQ
jgi:hypothetical protein